MTTPDYRAPLLAAVAEAAAGDTLTARGRIPDLLANPDPVLRDLVGVVAKFAHHLAALRGDDWTLRYGAGDDGRNLDERVPPDRALTLRLLATWPHDPDMAAALFNAAASHHREHLGDVFAHIVELVDRMTRRGLRPHAVVAALCRVIAGPGTEFDPTDSRTWPDP